MIKAILQFKDGLPSGRVWLRSVVKTVQRALLAGGFPVDPDGRFGGRTRSAIKEFQRQNGLPESGVFDAPAWLAAATLIEVATAAEVARIAALLDGFVGDLGWVHEREGHRGRPYWPGGVSGITLDPGVDLGHASSDLIENLYEPFLTAEQLAALRLVFGIRGEPARAELSGSAVIQAIRFTPEQALEVMPHGAAPYWERICLRFPSLRQPGTPASVQTALLSLAYNRGPSNRYLESLGPLLESATWDEAADKIAAMQQSHSLDGIRIRRRQEGKLIRSELEFLATA